MTDEPLETAPHADTTRPARAAGEGERRRRRHTNADGTVQRLEIPPAIRDRPDFERYSYRYVNDINNRIYRFTVQDDWEIVQENGVALKDNAGRAESTAVRYQVDVGGGGQPVYAYLCRKPKDFHQQDQDEKVQRTEDRARALEQGTDEEVSSEKSYAVKGNKAGRSVRRR